MNYRATTSAQTASTCGVVDHDDTCLCDVRITTPVPVDPNLNLLHCWEAPYIAKKMGYTGADESTSRTIEFLDALTRLYDQTATARQMRTNVQGDSIEANRELILNLLQDGHSMIDLADILSDFTGDDWSLGLVVQTATLNQPSKVWRWSELEWLRAEAWLVSEQGQHSLSELSAALQIAEVTVQVLGKWYGVKPYRSENKSNRYDEAAQARKDLLRGWLAHNPDLSNNGAYDLLVERGHTMSKSSVRNMLHKIRAA